MISKRSQIVCHKTLWVYLFMLLLLLLLLLLLCIKRKHKLIWWPYSHFYNKMLLQLTNWSALLGGFTVNDPKLNHKWIILYCSSNTSNITTHCQKECSLPPHTGPPATSWFAMIRDWRWWGHHCLSLSLQPFKGKILCVVSSTRC